MFETKAIFSLADFLKSLSANEYYDIAQKLYNDFADNEKKDPYWKLEKVAKIIIKKGSVQLRSTFLKWKQLNIFADLIDENDKLRQYINQLNSQNEMLIHEKNILEL